MDTTKTRQVLGKSDGGKLHNKMWEEVLLMNNVFFHKIQHQRYTSCCLQPLNALNGTQPGGIRQARQQILLGQLGIIFKDFIEGHSTGHQLQHKRDEIARAPDGGLAVTNGRINGDAFHDSNIRLLRGIGVYSSKIGSKNPRQSFKN